MTDKPIKVLVSGDIGGSFQQIFKRVETVNKSSAGPFDLLLCIGSFFLPYHNVNKDKLSKENESNDNENDNNNEDIPKELQPYLNGESTVPIPTYFIVNGQDEHQFLKKLIKNENNGELCNNLYYLGKSGVQSINGLNIAYLSGSVSYPVKEKKDNESDLSICRSDINHIIEQAKDKKIDILLTNQWARGILSNVDQSAIPPNIKNAMTKGMDGIKEVVIPLSPAYHFSKEANYYQRVPYLNPTSKLNPITRFIALAPVDNDRKQKYLFAMNYQPNSNTESNISDATGFPFIEKDNIKKQRNTIDGQQQQQRNNNNNRNQQSQSYSSKGGNDKKRVSTQECWFCLSQPHVETHLIVTIGSDSYLATPKGPIVEYHSLIVFIEHKPSIVSLSESEVQDVQKFITALREFYSDNNMVPIIFERHQQARFQNQLHGHLQVVPIPKNFVDQVEQAFTDEAAKKNIEFKKLDAGKQLSEAVNNNFYFNVILPNGEQLYTIIDKEDHLDLQFGRQVMVNLLKLPSEKMNWKKCAGSIEEETEQTLSFRSKFQPYFDKLDEE